MLEVVILVVLSIAVILETIIALDIRRRYIKEKEVDERANMRKKESLLSIDIANAGMLVDMTTAKFILGGSSKDELEEAIKNCESMKNAYEEFHKTIIAQQNDIIVKPIQTGSN